MADPKNPAPPAKKAPATGGMDRISETIKENEKIKEKARFQEELKKRITIAKNGRIAYEKKNLAEALTNYKKFLHLTARSFDVEVKDLHPKLFPEQSRVAEAILISAISFDLTKIYDHLKNNDAAIERAVYFRVLLNFSIGMPFQAFIADNVSRYVKYTPNIKHKSEFDQAAKALGARRGCFVATAVYQSADAPEVMKFRAFRDLVLMDSWYGRVGVRLYYTIGPSLAWFVERNAFGKKMARVALDSLVTKL